MEFLLLAICIGTIPGFIAQSKGRSFVAWWLYGAALFIVALPHSLLIKADPEQIEREQLQSGTSRKCPFCAEIIKVEALVCRFCGRDLPSTVDDDAITRKLVTALEQNKKGQSFGDDADDAITRRLVEALKRGKEGQ